MSFPFLLKHPLPFHLSWSHFLHCKYHMLWNSLKWKLLFLPCTLCLGTKWGSSWLFTLHHSAASRTLVYLRHSTFPYPLMPHFPFIVTGFPALLKSPPIPQAKDILLKDSSSGSWPSYSLIFSSILTYCRNSINESKWHYSLQSPNSLIYFPFF